MVLLAVSFMLTGDQGADAARDGAHVSASSPTKNAPSGTDPGPDAAAVRDGSPARADPAITPGETAGRDDQPEAGVQPPDGQAVAVPPEQPPQGPLLKVVTVPDGVPVEVGSILGRSPWEGRVESGKVAVRALFSTGAVNRDVMLGDADDSKTVMRFQ